MSGAGPPRRAFALSVVAMVVAGTVLACGGKSDREHTSTIVRGTYGDPTPIVACDGDASDGDASDGGADARDGC